MRAAFPNLSGGARACMCLTVLVLAIPAVGQLYAPGGVVPNPYAPPGYVPQNPIVQRFTPNMTNSYVTGNVTGGMSFRGFSPIRDASSLFLSVPSNFGANTTFGPSAVLPSDRLSYFVRDSYNLADQQSRRQFSPYVPGYGYTPWSSYNQGLPYAGRPYYSQQSTVASTGAIIQGLNRPGTSQMISPYLPPQSDASALTPGLSTTGGSRLGPSSWSVPDQLVRADTGRALTGNVNPRLLNSSLFGSAVRQVPLDALAAQAAHDQSFGQPAVGPLDLRAVREPLDLRVNQQATGQMQLGQPESPLDRLLGTQFAAQQRAAWMSPGPGQPGEPGAGIGLPARPPGAGQQPGDLFGHLQTVVGPMSPTPMLTGSPLREPNAPSEAVVPPGEQPPLANRPPGVKQPGGPGAAPHTPAGAASNTPMPPLRTFVGTEQSVINAYLADAEVQLKAGQYYRASAVYDLARSVDPDNPLAVLGRSMALLAAGDYLTSATDLFHAIRLFESLAQFRIDLKAFVPDLEVLDRRRADLERRLEARDDFRLRFLLGYAEYCSGLDEIGVANMTKAAQSVPPQMDAVKRFVETIQKRRQGQPQGTTPTTQPQEIPSDILGPADGPQ